MDRDICFACGSKGALLPGRVERCHIIAKWREGSNKPENIHLLCPICHKDSECFYDEKYWEWFQTRTLMDKMLSIMFYRGFNISQNHA